MFNQNQTVIKLEGISKVFLTDELKTHALKDVSFEIEDGQFVAINGPSGCGKSTLLSILGLLDKPTSGEYHLGGRQVANLSQADMAKIRNREVGALRGFTWDYCEDSSIFA